MTQHKPDCTTPTSLRARKITYGVSIAVFFILLILLFCFVGQPMMAMTSDPQAFREWISGYGVWSRILVVGMVAFQVVVAVIPGEPIEIACGYLFGIWEGTLLCLAGITLGSLLVFLLVRRFGMRAVELFFPQNKIQSLSFLQNTKRLNLIVFVIFFIPGTPKDILTYFIGLTPMKLWIWLLITMTARIPSVITSTIGGDALGMQNYEFALFVFAITLIISGIGIVVYKQISRREEKRSDGKKG